MSQNAYITGNKVILQNPYGGQNITIKHHLDGYDILFGSEVEFKYSTTHKEVKFGGFTITLNSNEDEMVFTKDGNTLMAIK